jgi:hypothetical protein
MAVSVEIVDPRVDAAPAGWAKFARRQELHPFWDYEMLRVEAWLSRNPPLLAVVRDGADVVGALSALVCRTWRTGDFSSAPGERTRSVRPRWAEVFVPLFSGHQACVFAGELDQPARTAAVRAFERELVAYLGPGLLGVLYRAMTADLVPAMVGTGRPHKVIDPVAVLTVPAVVPGPPPDLGLEVRAGFGRADLDPVGLAGLLNRQRADDDALAWAGGQPRRFGGVVHVDTRTTVASAYLDRFVRRPDVNTMTYHDANGALVAFNTLIDHPTRADMYHWAAAPDRADAASLYADCCARRVRYAADHGRRELSAGRGLLEVKRRLGFGTRELHTVAAPRPLLGR